MADVTDTLGVVGHVERERRAVDQADIDDRDRAAVLEFADHREVNEGVAPTTLRDDIGNLRRVAERAEKPLLEFESVKDATAFLKLNNAEYGVSEASNDNYRKVLRVFFEWVDSDPDLGPYEWWEDIHIPTRQPDPLDPQEVLSEEEIQELRDVADHAREKAFIEFLADTGMRLSAACQLRRRDLRGLDGGNPEFRVNRDGLSQKGMQAVFRPVIDSTIPLRTYLNEYHPDDHPDAPVFAVKDYETRERDDGAISNAGMASKLKKTAEAAGIDRDRVHPHAFRHVAVTRMRREHGLDWDQIAHMTGWSDKSIARMKGVYLHLTNEEKNEGIRRKAGAAGATKEPDEDDAPKSTECHNCEREIEARWSVCPHCEARSDARSVDGPAGNIEAELGALIIDKIESSPGVLLPMALGEMLGGSGAIDREARSISIEERELPSPDDFPEGATPEVAVVLEELKSMLEAADLDEGPFRRLSVGRGREI